MTEGSNEKIRKKRGRPATGRDPVTALRLAPVLKAAIERWAERQLGQPSRSEAIRRLLEFALAAQFKGHSEVIAREATGMRNSIRVAMREATRSLSQKSVVFFLPVQCRMARVALGLGVRDLAAAAKVAANTVARFERGEELKERTLDAIRIALEEGGVEFTNGDQPGVRLRKGTQSRDREAKNEPKPIIGRRLRPGARKP